MYIIIILNVDVIISTCLSPHETASGLLGVSSPTLKGAVGHSNVSVSVSVLLCYAFAHKENMAASFRAFTNFSTEY